jgi:EmrB/QacA subfamily drug resistance transporter
MGILIFASFMDLLDVTIVQVALPTIREDLGATPAQLEWIVSAYMLAFAVVLVTGGRLGDNLGRKRTYLIGVEGFTLASVVASIAATGDLLVAARVAQGAFAALMVPQALSTLQALYSPKERAPIYGIIGGVSGLAAVIAPVLGGWLVTADVAGLGWRSVFLLNVPVGIVIFALAMRFVPNTTSPSPLRLDIRGVLLLSGALFGILYPVVEGRALGWPAWLWLVAAAGVALAVAFVLVERARERQDGSALLPLSLFRNRGFSAGLITQASFQGAMNAFTIAWIIYMQATLGFDAFAVGLIMLPFSLGAFIGVGAAIPLATRVGKPIVALGALTQAGGIAWAVAIMSGRGTDLSGWDILLPLTLTGIGLGLLVVPLIDIALANVPLRDAGAASGTYGTFQQIGAAAGVAIAGTAFFAQLGTDFSQPSVMGALTTASGIAIGGYLLSAGASLLLPKRADVLRHQAEAARQVEEEEAALAASGHPVRRP